MGVGDRSIHGGSIQKGGQSGGDTGVQVGGTRSGGRAALSPGCSGGAGGTSGAARTDGAAAASPAAPKAPGTSGAARADGGRGVASPARLPGAAVGDAVGGGAVAPTRAVDSGAIDDAGGDGVIVAWPSQSARCPSGRCHSRRSAGIQPRTPVSVMTASQSPPEFWPKITTSSALKRRRTGASPSGSAYRSGATRRRTMHWDTRGVACAMRVDWPG